MDPIEKAMDSANLIDEDIEAVLLVGGSTRIPKIVQMLKSRFGNKVNE